MTKRRTPKAKPRREERARGWFWWGSATLAACCGGIVCVARAPAATASAAPSLALDAYVSTYKIRARHPHDPSAFTQGLGIDEAGRMYESDGLYHRSRVREVELETGSSTKSVPNAPKHFGEGLAFVGDRLLQLTWREGLMLEYDRASLELLRTLPSPLGSDLEGWGLAETKSDAAQGALYATDGSATLHVLDPASFETRRRMTVTDPALGDVPIHGLNELEVVGDEVWANVYPMRFHKASECVARIDPATGHVRGWIDLHGLFADQSERVRAAPLNYVLNGIAEHDGRLYVTGKQWDWLYEISVEPTQLNADHVRARCELALGDSQARRVPNPHHKHKAPPH